MKSIVTVFIASSIGIAITESVVARDENELRLVANERYFRSSSKLYRRIITAVASSNSMADSIVSEHVSIEDLTQLALATKSRFPAMDNLQISQGGVQTSVYQDKGSPTTGRKYHMHHRSQKAAAQRSLERMAVSISGPVENDGEFGTVVRSPVFLGNGSEAMFWGFVTSYVRLDDLFPESALKQSGGYHYLVTQIVDGQSTGSVWPPGSAEGSVEETVVLDLPDGVWSMQLIFSDNTLLSIRLVGFVCSLLLALLCGYLVYGGLNRISGLRIDLDKKNNCLRKYRSTDELTGLPNLKCFLNKTNEFLNNSSHTHHDGAIVLVQLMNWKEVIETTGYQFSNEIVKSIGNMITDNIDDVSLVSRCSESMFALLFKRGIEDKFDIEARLQSLDCALHQPIKFRGAKLLINISTGYTLTRATDNYAAVVMRRAERSLGGKKSYYLDYSVMANDILGLVDAGPSALVDDLGRAISNNQLEIVYQPIVCARTNTVIKAEALLRWNHPELGVVYPGDFIALAEQTGLIHEIGDWVFKQVAKDSQCFRSYYIDSFQISFNVSPEQLKRASFIEKWEAYLIEHGIDGAGLLIEITEGVLLVDDEILENQLRCFSRMNVGLTLDDFGTGYSSFFYLKRLNVEVLKIDRSFVKNLCTDDKDRILCSSILAIAAQLDIMVVAEGVEDVFQHEFLHSRGCDYLQGYLFSKPLGRPEFIKKLAKVSSYECESDLVVESLA